MMDPILGKASVALLVILVPLWVRRSHGCSIRQWAAHRLDVYVPRQPNMHPSPLGYHKPG